MKRKNDLFMIYELKNCEFIILVNNQNNCLEHDNKNGSKYIKKKSKKIF